MNSMRLMGGREITGLLVFGLVSMLPLVTGCTREIPVDSDSTPVKTRPTLKALPLTLLEYEFNGTAVPWKPLQRINISPEFHPDSLKYIASISPPTNGQNHFVGFGPIPKDSSQSISAFCKGMPMAFHIYSGDTTYYVTEVFVGSTTIFKAMVYSDSGEYESRTYTLTLTD